MAVERSVKPLSVVQGGNSLDISAVSRQNRLLGALPPATLAQLLPHLTPIKIKRGAVIYELDAPIGSVYFVTSGLLSLVKTMRDGRMVEIGAIGTEGVAGVNALFDVDTAMFETFMQVPGAALRIPVHELVKLMESDRLLHDLMEGYVHVILAQIAQTAACNRLHSIEERCCRWLLTCHDSAGGDEFLLTQEFLAVMLGVRRVSVTIAASGLQKAGFIKYRRGRLTVTSRAGLEAQACECYATVRAITDRLLSGKYPV